MSEQKKSLKKMLSRLLIRAVKWIAVIILIGFFSKFIGLLFDMNIENWIEGQGLDELLTKWIPVNGKDVIDNVVGGVKFLLGPFGWGFLIAHSLWITGNWQSAQSLFTRFFGLDSDDELSKIRGRIKSHNFVGNAGKALIMVDCSLTNGGAAVTVDSYEIALITYDNKVHKCEIQEEITGRSKGNKPAGNIQRKNYLPVITTERIETGAMVRGWLAAELPTEYESIVKNTEKIAVKALDGYGNVIQFEHLMRNNRA